MESKPIRKELDITNKSLLLLELSILHDNNNNILTNQRLLIMYL